MSSESSSAPYNEGGDLSQLADGSTPEAAGSGSSSQQGHMRPLGASDGHSPASAAAAAGGQGRAHGNTNGRATQPSQMSSGSYSYGGLDTATTDELTLGDDGDDDDDGMGGPTQSSQSPQGINLRVVALRRALVNERLAPDILPYQSEIVDVLMTEVKRQQEIIDESQNNADAVFIASMYQMDIDRVQYLISSYLRTRLIKIKENCTYILANHDTMLDKLSSAEQEWVRTYADLMHTHLSESALDSLPELYQKLNDDEQIREGPDLDKFVVCHVLEDLGPLSSITGATGDDIAVEEGSTYLLPYRHIRDHLLNDRVELR
eukprot:gb/GECG01012840.1/.p1 GENE.gb/GECG01012840.1/~~gb/GECG01012840.1/.p1  ORF type:complete len:319 (+),score=40.75 gb/GECG01012840.1/:1-957(+)